MRSSNDEGLQLPKFHFPWNNEERVVLNSFFREYKPLQKITINLKKVAYHPVSCLLHLQMPYQIIQHNKLCLNKYLLIKDGVQEEVNVWKVHKPIQCCDTLKQIKKNVFVKIWQRFKMSHLCIQRRYRGVSVWLESVP